METVSPKVLTVSQITAYMKSELEGDPRLQNVLVSGEISGYTVARSGHVYFSLKDDNAVLRAVIWRSNAGRLKFRPDNGMKVIAFGKISLYPPRGEYQLNVQSLQPDGVGALSLAYEQLKKRLEKEGLFDPAHKKQIPEYPQKIGVVTSPSTAAYQDILKVLRRRWPIAEVTICPATVQGVDAPPTIVNALKTIDGAGMDVIILARGGGSMEDLWCFNDEQVARTVYECKTPIVTGVGHQTDTTLVDYVADLSTNTPSAAAERVSPDQNEEFDRILQMRNRIRTALQNRINNDRERIEYWKASNALNGFPGMLDDKRMRVDDLSAEIGRSIGQKLDQEENKVWMYLGKLKAYAPETRIQQQQKYLEQLTVRLSNQSGFCQPRKVQLLRTWERFNRAYTEYTARERNRFSQYSAKLDAYSPLKVLARGYSMAAREDGTIIKSTNQLSEGESFRLRLSDGTAVCRTEEILKEESHNGGKK